MSRLIRTAVAAAASQASRMQIVRGLSAAGIELVRMCGDGASALEALNSFRPDLLAADVQLPRMDGAALAVCALCSFTLPVRPAALLLYDAGYPLPTREKLEAVGAAFVEKPASPDSFIGVAALLQSSDPVFQKSEEQAADLLLDALGVPLHRGRDCLKLAALHCAADERLKRNLGGRLYPMIGRICNLDAMQAERAMRHVIDLAWQSDKFDNQYRIFADTVDAGRGQPTCSEMISRLADILRLEG